MAVSAAPDCERARFWASLAVDGELSELEHLSLDQHLVECPACAAFVDEMQSFTAAIRGARDETPAVELAPAARRRRTRPALFAAAVVVVAVAAGIGSLAGLLSHGGGVRPLRSEAASRAQFVRQQVLALELGTAPRRTGHGRVIPG